MNENELLAAISAALQQAPTGEAMTMREITEALSMGECAVRVALRRLFQAGQLVCVKVWRPTITGCPQRVPGYRVKT